MIKSRLLPLALISLTLTKTTRINAFPVDWNALAGLRVYQHKFADLSNFQARGRESYFSILFRPVSALPASVGLGFQFVNFSSADWQGPDHKATIRSPAMEIALTPLQTSNINLNLKYRWTKGGGFYFSFTDPERSEEEKSGRPEYISLEGHHVSLGASLTLTPLAALLFEFAKGIEYTFDSITGEKTSLRPVTFLAGFRVGLHDSG